MSKDTGSDVALLERALRGSSERFKTRGRGEVATAGGRPGVVVGQDAGLMQRVRDRAHANPGHNYAGMAVLAGAYPPDVRRGVIAEWDPEAGGMTERARLWFGFAHPITGQIIGQAPEDSDEMSSLLDVVYDAYPDELEPWAGRSLFIEVCFEERETSPNQRGQTRRYGLPVSLDLIGEEDNLGEYLHGIEGASEGVEVGEGEEL